MKADKQTELAIKNMLEQYAQAYANKNLEAMIELFAQDHDLVAIGTGKDEWIQGPENLKEGFKRDLSQADDIKVKFENITISAAGNIAWSSALMTMYATVSGQKVMLSGRLSTVLEKRGDKWLFVHLHFSLPASEQEEGYSFPE